MSLDKDIISEYENFDAKIMKRKESRFPSSGEKVPFPIFTLSTTIVENVYNFLVQKIRLVCYEVM